MESPIHECIYQGTVTVTSAPVTTGLPVDSKNAILAVLAFDQDDAGNNNQFYPLQKNNFEEMNSSGVQV